MKRISKWFKKHKSFLLKKRAILAVFLVVSLAEIVFVLGILNVIPFSRFLATVFPNVLIGMANTNN